MKDERLLSQEVEALDRRFESWSLPGAAADGVNPAVDGARTQRTTALPSSRDAIANLPPDVAAFEVNSHLSSAFISYKHNRVGFSSTGPFCWNYCS